MTKSVGGLCYVWSSGRIYECIPRGRLKKDGRDILVGDRVLFEAGQGPAGSPGVVSEILPRHTELKRPVIANVDQAVIVMAAAQPEPNLSLLDRLLVLAHASGLETVICLSKADLVKPSQIRALADIYRAAGYQVIPVSTVTRKGKRKLLSALKGRISVLAGPSGVGKSSILNMLVPGANLATGDVSRKLGRGRHTTRHAQLLPLSGGGFIADTPGFSALSLDFVEKKALGGLFPEIARYAGGCRFTGCLHDKEPDCAVKEAVARGEIPAVRYQHYQDFLEEVREFEDRKYR